MADSPLAAWLRSQDPAEDATEDAPAGQPLPWDLGDEPASPGRGRRLLLLAGLPWLAAVAIGGALLAGGRGAPEPAVAVAEPPVAALPEPLPAAGPGATGPLAESPVTAVPQPLPTAGPGATDPDRAGLAEAGALVVRALLDPATPVEAAVSTGVEPVGDAWVVTVLVLASGPAPGEGTALQRYAVALSDGAAGPVALSGPWPLPPPAAGLPAVAPVTVDDPALRERVTVALAGAGYGEPTGLDLARDPSLPGVLLARVAGAASRPGTWTVWLTDEPEPRLLGAS